MLRILNVCVLLSSFLVTGYAQSSANQTRPNRGSQAPRTVLECFRTLPGAYFAIEREKREGWMLDPSRGAIVDRANGYLYAPGDGAQSDLTLCVFEQRGGGIVVGVKYHAGDTSSVTYLDVLEYRKGRWRDVTKKVLPVVVEGELRIEMPRVGTTIRVTTAGGEAAYDLLWTGVEFRLRRP